MSELGVDWVLCLQGRHSPRTREQQGQRQRSRIDMIDLHDIHKLVGGEAWLSLGGGEVRGEGTAERRLRGRLGQDQEGAFLTPFHTHKSELWTVESQEAAERQTQKRRGGTQ